MSAVQSLVQDHYWRPGMPSSGEPAVCRIARCRYQLSQSYESQGGGPDGAPCPRPSTGIAGIDDFTKPRLIIWYQSHCVACKNSKETVFPALTEAAKLRGFTVHEQEATPEMLQRFPHVQMVPLYDLITPTGDPNKCSEYGPGTERKTIRNDLRALRVEFPTFSIAPAPAAK